MKEDGLIDIVDKHFALLLGCRPENLRRPGVTAVPYISGEVDKDRTPPKPIWIVRRNESCIISATPWALEAVQPYLNACKSSASLAEAPLKEIKAIIESKVDIWFWFLGYQFYVDNSTFTPSFDHRCRIVTPNDPAAEDLAARHCLAFNGVSIENGDVYGIFDGDKLASYSWIKPRSELAAAIGVVTAEEYRRKGFGRAVVSAATAEILRRGKIPIYDCDQDNAASANLAESLGYRFYCEDFGCIQRNAPSGS